MQKTIIFLFFCHQFSSCVAFYEIYFASASGIPGDEQTLADYSGMRITLNSERKRVLNGTFKYLVNFDDAYTVKLSSLFSSQGSSFHRDAYGVTKTFCEFMKTVYVRYGQPMFVGKSNFPIITENGPCPEGFQGDFYLKAGLIGDISPTFPEHVAGPFHKVTTEFYDSNKKMVGGLEIVFHVQ